MALKSQCFLPDGTAHTQGLWELPQLPAELCALRTPRMPGKGCQGRDAREGTQAQQWLLCWAALGLITKEPLPPFLMQNQFPHVPLSLQRDQGVHLILVLFLQASTKWSVRRLINAQSMVPWLPVTLDPWLSKLQQEWFLYTQNYSIMSAVCP